MSETTREQLVEMLLNNADRQNIAMVLNDAIHKLDRLEQAEELLSKALNHMDNPNPLSRLDERIETFLAAWR